METLQAKIYLNELRGSNLIDEADPFRTLQCFFYQTLHGGGVLKENIGADGYLVVIPVTGDLIFTLFGQDTEALEELEIAVGQVLITTVAALSAFRLLNPFTGDEVNFMWFTIAASPTYPLKKLLDFELAAGNGFISLFDGVADQASFRLHLGQFAGREETLFRLSPDYKGVFCFALTGAFELCGRLLHPKDGLALWEVAEAELEALSNNALMLLLEIP
ncbi:hypothetical protein D3C86_1176100 [compost metagenome]